MTGPDLDAADRGAVDLRLSDLALVGGSGLVARLLARFEEELAALLGAGRATPPLWDAHVIHRTVGTAGILGFERLEAACRALEDAADASPALIDAVCAAAAAALAEVRRRLASETAARAPQQGS